MKFMLFIFLYSSVGSHDMYQIPFQTIELCEKAKTEYMEKPKLDYHDDVGKNKTMCVQVSE